MSEQEQSLGKVTADFAQILERVKGKTTPEQVVARWQRERPDLHPPPALALLISFDGKTKSVIGDILSNLEISDDELLGMQDTFNLNQLDLLMAKALGITTLQARLLSHPIGPHGRPLGGEDLKKLDPWLYEAYLRYINEVSDALIRPEKLLGQYCELTLSFAQLIDNYNFEEWEKIKDSANRAYCDNFSGWVTAEGAVGKAIDPFTRASYTFQNSFYLTSLSVESYVGRYNHRAVFASIHAAVEIQAHQTLKEQGIKPYFLPMFFDGEGRPLTIEWLKEHPYERKLFAGVFDNS